MYKSIPDGFKQIKATEGFKGFTLVSILAQLAFWRTRASGADSPIRAGSGDVIARCWS